MIIIFIIIIILRYRNDKRSINRTIGNTNKNSHAHKATFLFET